MKAWLVTWESAGTRIKIKNSVAAILSSRTSPERVCEIIEVLYVNHNFTLAERIAYSNNKKFNPYPAYFDRINGIPYLGRVHCGHNPYLFARKVDKLKVTKDENGNEVLTWKEIPKPNPEVFT
jgi:hypothetical protein